MKFKTLKTFFVCNSQIEVFSKWTRKSKLVFWVFSKCFWLFCYFFVFGKFLPKFLKKNISFKKIRCDIYYPLDNKVFLTLLFCKSLNYLLILFNSICNFSDVFESSTTFFFKFFAFKSELNNWSISQLKLRLESKSGKNHFCWMKVA